MNKMRIHVPVAGQIASWLLLWRP